MEADIKQIANKTVERLELEEKRANTCDYVKKRYQEFIYGTKRHRKLMKEYNKEISKKQKEIDETALSVLKDFEHSRSFKAYKEKQNE